MNRRAVAILLLSAALNLWGVSWGTPDPAYAPTDVADHTLNPQALVHPDAFQFAGRSFRMAATGDWNPRFFENPSLYININLLLHTFSGVAAEHPVPADYPMRQYAPFPPYVMGRVVSALAGVLLAAFTLALTRLAFGERAGELAALLMAVSPVAVQHSHYATTNVTAAALATGAAWASLRLLCEREPASAREYIAAGLLVGLACSAKYNAGIVGVVYVLAGLVGVYRHRAWQLFVLGLLAIAVGFLVGTPYAALDVRAFWGDLRYITAEYAGGQGYPESDYGLAFHTAHIAWFGLGPVGAALGLIGVCAAMSRRRSLARNSPALYAGLLVAFVVAYALIVLRAPRLGDHLTIPVLGALAAFAGAGAARVLKRIGALAVRAAWAKRVLAAGLVGALVAVPLPYAVWFDALLAQPDTRELAQAWIYAHVRRGEHVHLIGPYNAPLDPADYQATQDFGYEYQPPEEIRAQGATVAIVSDAVSFLFDGAEPFIPSALPEYVRGSLARYEAEMMWVARFQRPRWFGDNWPLSTAAYFHNPTLTVYCFPDVCTQVVKP
jgi:hypothetical protein